MAEESEPGEKVSAPLVVVDLGRKKARQVKRLRKGGGKLLDQVQATVADLIADGVLQADVQTVVVVVERRRELPWRL